MWAKVVEHRQRFEATGEFAKKRRDQQVKWMWTMLEDLLFSRLRSDAQVRALLPDLERRVAEGSLSPTLAVEKIAAAARAMSAFPTRKSLLVAGFGAFPGQQVNPAETVVRRLEKAKAVFALAGIDLHTAVLPVERHALSPALSKLFAWTSPDAVLLLGVAGRRRRLTIETLARNRASILKPDAAKQRAYCRFLVHGGPAF